MAQNQLGMTFYRGDPISRDSAAAVHWVRKAAEQGFALAQFNLGTMYFIGDCIPQDDGKAHFWFKKAVFGGYHPGAFAMGLLYLYGRGVEMDTVEAYAWFIIGEKVGSEGAPPKREALASSLSEFEKSSAEQRTVELFKEIGYAEGLNG